MGWGCATCSAFNVPCVLGCLQRRHTGCCRQVEGVGHASFSGALGLSRACEPEAMLRQHVSSGQEGCIVQGSCAILPGPLALARAGAARPMYVTSGLERACTARPQRIMLMVGAARRGASASRPRARRGAGRCRSRARPASATAASPPASRRAWPRAAALAEAADFAWRRGGVTGSLLSVLTRTLCVCNKPCPPHTQYHWLGSCRRIHAGALSCQHKNQDIVPNLCPVNINT